jgi:hypothetical protein
MSRDRVGMKRGDSSLVHVVKTRHTSSQSSPSLCSSDTPLRLLCFQAQPPYICVIFRNCTHSDALSIRPNYSTATASPEHVDLVVEEELIKKQRHTSAGSREMAGFRVSSLEFSEIKLVACCYRSYQYSTRRGCLISLVSNLTKMTVGETRQR